MDYAAFGKPTLSKDLTPDFSSSILRLARLEELLTEGEKCDSAEEGMEQITHGLTVTVKRKTSNAWTYSDCQMQDNK